jgi:hypothetical protein
MLGGEHLATIWTKLLLGWTTQLFSPQDPTRCNSAWTFLNSARNDLQELYKDKTGPHPFDVIIQYALALCASRAHPTGSILHSTSADDFELVMQKLWRRQGRPLNIEQILDVKFNLLFSEYGSKSRSVKTTSDVEEIKLFVSSAQELLGPEHPITLCGLRFLRMVSMSTAKPHPQLVTDSLEMIETIKKVLGPDHGLALLAQLDLAQVYIADGADSSYKARGLSLLTEILPPIVRRYGPDNPIPKHIATLVRQFGTQRPDATVHYWLTEANRLLQKYDYDSNFVPKPLFVTPGVSQI